MLRVQVKWLFKDKFYICYCNNNCFFNFLIYKYIKIIFLKKIIFNDSDETIQKKIYLKKKHNLAEKINYTKID